MTFDFNWPLFIIIAIAGFLYGEYRAWNVREAYSKSDEAILNFIGEAARSAQQKAVIQGMQNLLTTLKSKNLIHEDEHGTLHGYNGSQYTAEQAVTDIIETQKRIAEKIKQTQNSQIKNG